MAAVRERWLSTRALSLHTAALVVVSGCAVAAWWQVTAPRTAISCSYLYSVMWPVFGLLAVCFWWMLIHTDYDTVGLKGLRRQQASRTTRRARRYARSGPRAPTGVRRRAPPPRRTPSWPPTTRGWPISPRRGPERGADRETVVVRRAPVRRLLERGLRGALFRYQLMANVVGVLIIPLFFFTGLHIAFGGYKVELAIFGVGHGYLYIVYLIVAGYLALKVRAPHPLDHLDVRCRTRPPD